MKSPQDTTPKQHKKALERSVTLQSTSCDAHHLDSVQVIRRKYKEMFQNLASDRGAGTGVLVSFCIKSSGRKRQTY